MYWLIDMLRPVVVDQLNVSKNVSKGEDDINSFYLAFSRLYVFESKLKRLEF